MGRASSLSGLPPANPDRGVHVVFLVAHLHCFPQSVRRSPPSPTTYRHAHRGCAEPDGAPQQGRLTCAVRIQHWNVRASPRVVSIARLGLPLTAGLCHPVPRPPQPSASAVAAASPRGPPLTSFFFFFVPEATSLFPRPDMGRRKGQQERFGSGRASRAGRDQETACATHRGPFTLGPGTNVVEPRLAARADWTICLARPVARARIGHCLVRCMHRGPDTRTKTRSLVPASRTWTRPRRDGLPAATSRFQSAFI